MNEYFRGGPARVNYWEWGFEVVFPGLKGFTAAYLYDRGLQGHTLEHGNGPGRDPVGGRVGFLRL